MLLYILYLNIVHKGGVMGLNGIRMMHLFMGLSILSLSVQAEVDSPSFYGKRSVAPIESETAQEPITFQRRAIVITSESNNTEETSLDSILAIDIVNRELIPSVTDNKIEKQKNMKVRPLLELSRNEKLLAKKPIIILNATGIKTLG